MFSIRLCRSSIINKLLDQQRTIQVPCLNVGHSFSRKEVDQRSEKCLNTVQLLGRVAIGPEQKGVSKMVTAFVLSTDSNYRLETRKFIKSTQWHRIICFNKELQSYVLNKVKKGDRLYITGHIEYTDYTDRDGKLICRTRIVAQDIVISEDESGQRYQNNLA